MLTVLMMMFWPPTYAPTRTCIEMARRNAVSSPRRINLFMTISMTVEQTGLRGCAGDTCSRQVALPEVQVLQAPGLRTEHRTGGAPRRHTEPSARGGRLGPGALMTSSIERRKTTPSHRPKGVKKSCNWGDHPICAGLRGWSCLRSTRVFGRIRGYLVGSLDGGTIPFKRM